MAIDNKGRPTTTGIMNDGPNIPKAPNLSALGRGQDMPKQETPKVTAEPEPRNPLKDEFPEATDMELEFAERAKSLTDEDQAALQTVLSPSVRKALGKIIPEFKEVMDAYGTNEPNVVIPASLMSSYAMRVYGVQNQNEALARFYDDVTSDIDQQIGQQQQTNVPPGNQMAESTPGLMEPSAPNPMMTSPQTNKTV
jgi:hypothetical protein